LRITSAMHLVTNDSEVVASHGAPDAEVSLPGSCIICTSARTRLSLAGGPLALKFLKPMSSPSVLSIVLLDGPPQGFVFLAKRL
jgi:hypothetical protein